MTPYVRRALVAATVPFLLPGAAPANAACVATVCVATPADPGSLLAYLERDLPGGTGSGGGGVLCLYAKRQAPPPPGWSGGSSETGPYFWQQTQRWGEQNRGHYDFQACAPACPTLEPLAQDGPCPDDRD